jgi:glutamate--cysteine ligase catalytic subunit
MDSSWKPEFGRYMLEGTPGLPYGSTLADLLKVEENMVKRRQLGQSLLKSNQKLVSCTSFPLLGVDGTVNAKPTPMTGASRSLYVPDQVIHPHARFP